MDSEISTKAARWRSQSISRKYASTSRGFGRRYRGNLCECQGGSRAPGDNDSAKIFSCPGGEIPQIDDRQTVEGKFRTHAEGYLGPWRDMVGGILRVIGWHDGEYDTGVRRAPGTGR